MFSLTAYGINHYFFSLLALLCVARRTNNCTQTADAAAPRAPRINSPKFLGIATIGALIIRKAFWGPFCYNYNKESPKQYRQLLSPYSTSLLLSSSLDFTGSGTGCSTPSPSSTDLSMGPFRGVGVHDCGWDKPETLVRKA